MLVVSRIKVELKAVMKHIQTVLDNAGSYELTYENFETILKALPKCAYPNLALKRQLLLFVETLNPYASSYYNVPEIRMTPIRLNFALNMELSTRVKDMRKSQRKISREA